MAITANTTHDKCLPRLATRAIIPVTANVAPTTLDNVGQQEGHLAVRLRQGPQHWQYPPFMIGHRVLFMSEQEPRPYVKGNVFHLVERITKDSP